MVKLRVSRFVLALLLLAMLLLAVSGLLELNSAVRMSASQAQVEAVLVSGSIERDVAVWMRHLPDDSLSTLRRDPELTETFMDALARAPSILHLSVLDTNRVAVAHSEAGLLGTTRPELPPLPVPRRTFDTFGLLWTLWRAPQSYQVETQLAREGHPFAIIRVVVGGSFLRNAVKDASSRGMITALFVIALAVLAGVLLSRMAMGRIRVLERGVEAFRAGHFEERVPETEFEEFNRLTRALNLLGEQFSMRRPETRGKSAPPETHPLPLSADQSRVLTRLGEAAATVAHELRNHLQTVRFDLEQLQRADMLTSAEVRGRVDSALTAAQSLGGSVGGFLKVARVKPLAPRRVNLNELVGNLCVELQPEVRLAGADLVSQPDPAVPDIWVDPEVLRQALHNLVRNSLQAFGGREGRITIRTGADMGMTRISVGDDGPGIPPDVLDRVFDFYFTTRREGSGVGLALVRQAIEMHGGDVKIRSTPGQGTEVILELPLRSGNGSGK